MADNFNTTNPITPQSRLPDKPRNNLKSNPSFPTPSAYPTKRDKTAKRGAKRLLLQGEKAGMRASNPKTNLGFAPVTAPDIWVADEVMRRIRQFIFAKFGMKKYS